MSAPVGTTSTALTWERIPEAARVSIFKFLSISKMYVTQQVSHEWSKTTQFALSMVSHSIEYRKSHPARF